MHLLFDRPVCLGPHAIFVHLKRERSNLTFYRLEGGVLDLEGDS